MKWFGKKLVYVIHFSTTWTDMDNLKETYDVELYESWFGRSINVASYGFVRVYNTHTNHKLWPLIVRWKRGRITLDEVKERLSYYD